MMDTHFFLYLSYKVTVSRCSGQRMTQTFINVFQLILDHFFPDAVIFNRNKMKFDYGMRMDVLENNILYYFIFCQLSWKRMRSNIL